MLCFALQHGNYKMLGTFIERARKTANLTK